MFKWPNPDVVNNPIGLEIWINLDNVATVALVPPQKHELHRTLQVTMSFGGQMMTTDGSVIDAFLAATGAV